MNPAPNLVLVGPMGAGKSSIGKRLAERLGLAFVDADRDVELRTGVAVGTIFECEGETGFRARERTALAELLAGEGQLIATGGGAVLDAGNRERMRARGFEVYLQVDVAGQLERLARDRTRPLLQRDDREDVLRQLSTTRAPLYAEVADLCFDTNGLGSSDAACQLGRLLAGRWQRGAALRDGSGQA
jgi:shikimate kinase